ncbi:MAG: transporter substrate-binding domain-containing protein [Hyphomicrobiales bacterium]
MNISCLKKPVIGVFAVLAMLSMAAVAKAGNDKTLVIATEGAWPPFNYVEPDGTIAGFEVDLGQAICKQMGVKCKFVIHDFSTMVTAVAKHKYDLGMAGYNATPERKKKVNFTDKYADPAPAVLVRKDSDIRSATDEGLSGKKLGVQPNSLHESYAEKHFPHAKLSLYEKTDEENLDLSIGRIDATMDDSVPQMEWLKTQGAACCKLLAVVPVDHELSGGGIGALVAKDRPQLLKRFNDALAVIIENGTFKKLDDKYFPGVNIYGEPY